METVTIEVAVSEERALERKAADTHVALVEFMNRTPLPFSPSAKAEYEELLLAATQARIAYLKAANALGIGPLQTYCIR